MNFIQNGTTAFPMSLYLIVQLVAFHIYDSTIVITRRSNWNCREITLRTIFASRHVDSDRAQSIKIGPFKFSFRQIRSLMGEESLNDVNISFG